MLVHMVKGAPLVVHFDGALERTKYPQMPVFLGLSVAQASAPT